MKRKDTFSKFTTGEIDQIGFDDGVNVARVATGLIPGGVSQMVIDAPLAGLQGSRQTREAKEDISDLLGSKDTYSFCKDSPLLKRKLAAADSMTASNVEGAVISGAGALAGMAAVPFAPWAGSLGGGYLGSALSGSILDNVTASRDQDTVNLVGQIRMAQKNGEKVPAGVVFAAVAATMANEEGKKQTLKNRLEVLTGTRNFSQAVAQGNIRQLEKMAREFDTEVRAHTGLPLSRLNPFKNASQQYADKINRHKVDARALLFDPNSKVGYSMMHPVAQPVDPVMPPIGQQDMRTLASNMRNMGIAPAGQNEPNPALPPRASRAPSLN